MSHFTVLVIGDNPEEQLAPYQENNMGDCPEEYMEWHSREEEFRHEYENEGTDKVILPDGRYVAPWDDMFNKPDAVGFGTGTHEVPEGLERREVPFNELYDSLEEFAEEWHGHKNREPRTGEYGYWENPQAKWDWYQIGGRWTGMLKLKPRKLLPPPDFFDKFGFSQAEFLNLVNLHNKDISKFHELVSKYAGKAADIISAVETYTTDVLPEHAVGSPGLMTESPERGYCDQCYIGDLDIEGMEKESMDKALKEHQKFIDEVLIPSKGVICESWDYIRDVMFPGDIDRARNYNNTHPFTKLCNKAGIHFFGESAYDVYHLDKVDYKGKYIENVDLTKSTFAVLEDARCRAFSTFAVLKDGQWYEKGEMGWWGVVLDEQLKYDWNSKFMELIHDLSDDTLISIVDCHI